jgi:hypothetical protein
MSTRRSDNRRCRPVVEGLGGRLLPSVGLPNVSAAALAGVPTLVTSRPGHEGVAPCGTGTGIIIITRFQNSPSSTLVRIGAGEGTPIVS